MDEETGAVKLLCNFFSSFYIFLSSHMRDTMTEIIVDPQLVRKKYLRQTTVCQAERMHIRHCGQQHWSITGGCVLSPVLFTLYVDFQHYAVMCQAQKYTDDSEMDKGRNRRA